MQTICKNLEGEVRRNIPRFQGNRRLCFHGSSGCLCSVSHNHVPTFCPCSRGQARSTQERSLFSSEKCSLLLLCILAPLMLSVKPGVSGISISTRLCEQTPGQSCSWEECRYVKGLFWTHAERAGRIRRCKGQWMRAEAGDPQTPGDSGEEWALSVDGGTLPGVRRQVCTNHQNDLGQGI